MKKLVSIAIATYNGEKFLRKQLDSIYAQTYKNIEVVVTDDCSSDGTVDILNEYKNNYGLRYYINEQNLGFIKNFEKVISLCRGDYVALSDQDDIWVPSKIETLVREIGDYSLVCSDAALIDNDDTVVVNSFNDYSGRSIPTENIFQYLVFGNYVTGCTAMIDSKLFSKALPVPEEFPFHDWWFAIMASQERGIKYVPEQFVLYRQHNDNVSGAGKKISLYSFFSTIATKKKEIKHQYVLKNKRIKFLLANNIYKNAKEKQFLEDALKFTNLYIGKKSTFKSVFFAMNNSNKIPQKDNFWIQILRTNYLLYKFLFTHSKSILENIEK